MWSPVVFEKHLTLNHAWKGTDHKFSLEPPGFERLVRDLNRIDESLGLSEKKFLEGEKSAKVKMGKSVYYTKDIK